MSTLMIELPVESEVFITLRDTESVIQISYEFKTFKALVSRNDCQLLWNKCYLGQTFMMFHN